VSKMLNERKLTKNELKQTKISMKGMLKNTRSFIRKYGRDAEKVMYGTAIKQAKKKVENMNLDNLRSMIEDALTVKEASPFVLAADAARDAGKKEFEFPKGSGKMHPVTIKQDVKTEALDSNEVETLKKMKANLEAEMDQLLRDMEQEAEMEGGPIADEYGKRLNDIEDSLYNINKQLNPRELEEENKDNIEFEEEDFEYDDDNTNEVDKVAADIQKALNKHEGDEAKIFQIQRARKALNKGDIEKAKEIVNRYLQEEIGEDLDVGHQDNEPHMLKKDLYRIAKYSSELFRMMNKYDQDGEVDFPHWWQSKIIEAKNLLSSAKHYLEGEEKVAQIDNMLDENNLEEQNKMMMKGKMNGRDIIIILDNPDSENWTVVDVGTKKTTTLGQEAKNIDHSSLNWVQDVKSKFNEEIKAGSARWWNILKKLIPGSKFYFLWLSKLTKGTPVDKPYPRNRSLKNLGRKNESLSLQEEMDGGRLFDYIDTNYFKEPRPNYSENTTLVKRTKDSKYDYVIFDYDKDRDQFKIREVAGQGKIDPKLMEKYKLFLVKSGTSFAGVDKYITTGNSDPIPISTKDLKDLIDYIMAGVERQGEDEGGYVRSIGIKPGIGDQYEGLIKKHVREALGKKKITEEFKVGDKVTYLGHPAEITKVDKDIMDRVYYNVSYDKGNGKTKATNIYNKGNEIKALEEKLTKKSDVGDFVDDFQKSDAKQFKGKSKKKKHKMAVAAYLAKQDKK
jgi:hypothetical protein